MSKIIKVAQVKDRNQNNGEWSQFVIGENNVKEIESGIVGEVPFLIIRLDNNSHLEYFNVPFWVKYFPE